MQSKKHTQSIAVLQTGRAPEELRNLHGDYDAMCASFLGRGSEETEIFPVVDGQFPLSLESFDCFVISGSRHGVYEDHEWIEPLENLIREAREHEKKVIGFCFGHQIIAQALGGKVEQSDRGLGAGVMEYDFKVQNGETKRLALLAWHQDQITRMPTEASIIASSEFCPIAALAYGNWAISFQAHPEFSPDYVADLVEVRRDEMLPEVAKRAIESLDMSTDSAFVKDIVEEFLAS